MLNNIWFHDSNVSLHSWANSFKYSIAFPISPLQTFIENFLWFFLKQDRVGKKKCAKFYSPLLYLLVFTFTLNLPPKRNQMIFLKAQKPQDHLVFISQKHAGYPLNSNLTYHHLQIQNVLREYSAPPLRKWFHFMRCNK